MRHLLQALSRSHPKGLAFSPQPLPLLSLLPLFLLHRTTLFVCGRSPARSCPRQQHAQLPLQPHNLDEKPRVASTARTHGGHSSLHHVLVHHLGSCLMRPHSKLNLGGRQHLILQDHAPNLGAAQALIGARAGGKPPLPRL
jgi:hypothetical protein